MGARRGHAAFSFVVAHEGCSSSGPEFGDHGSGARKRDCEGRGRKIGCTGRPQSADRPRPRISGTPKNHTHLAHLDIADHSHDGAQRLAQAPQVVPN